MNTVTFVAEVVDFQSGSFDDKEILLKLKIKGGGWARVVMSKKMVRSLINSLQSNLNMGARITRDDITRVD